MDFAHALELLRKGQRMTRASWPRHTWIALQRPDRQSKMTGAYLYGQDARGTLAPWSAAHADLLAEDWLAVYHVEQTQPQAA